MCLKPTYGAAGISVCTRPTVYATCMLSLLPRSAAYFLCSALPEPCSVLPIYGAAWLQAARNVQSQLMLAAGLSLVPKAAGVTSIALIIKQLV